MANIFLAIDVGTSSLRALIVAAGGALLGKGHAEVQSTYPAPGHVEQDAEAIWLQTLGVVDQALSEAGVTKSDLKAIGITTQRSSAVVWNKMTSKAVVPMLVWSDLRGSTRAEELQASGYFIAAQMAAAKLEGLVETAMAGSGISDINQLAWGNIDSFLVWKLSGGAHITDASQAIGTGYLDVFKMDWNPSLIADQGLEALAFPTIGDTWGTLASTSKKSFGAEVPITALIADQQCAMIGHGCIEPGDAKITFGTSGTFNVNTGTELKMVSPSVVPFVQYALGGVPTFCLEGMVVTAGAVFDWLADGLEMASNAAETQSLADSVPDCGGVFVLPALQGLGAPYGQLDQKALIGGLTRGSTKAHIVRAAHEGVAFRVREIVDTVYNTTDIVAPQQISVDGGASDNDLLMQIQADMLALPVARHSVRDATAYGAALCAVLGVGDISLADIPGYVHHDRIFEPQLTAEEAAAKLKVWQKHVYASI
jgi:glycerol kinase